MSDGLRKIAFIVMLLAALGWIAGCAAGSQALLAEDYKAMDNENLLRYYSVSYTHLTLPTIYSV